jgi:hypothetical protein
MDFWKNLNLKNPRSLSLRLELDFLQEQDYSFGHTIQTNSEAYPAFYPMCAEDSFPKGKGGWNVRLITHLHKVLSFRCLQLYIYAAYILTGVVLWQKINFNYHKGNIFKNMLVLKRLNGPK